MASKRADLVRGYATISEFAEALGISALTVTRWVRQGKLPSIQIGRTRLIPEDALRRLEAASGDSTRGRRTVKR